MRASRGFPIKMFEGASSSTNIRKELVLAYIRKHHPATIKNLRQRLAEEGISATDDALVEVVDQLESEGIGIGYLGREDSFIAFLRDLYLSWWIYCAILVSAVETLLVIYQQQTGMLAILRILFGLGLLGLLPGYATTQAVLPGEQLTQLEKVLLSVFLSVVISIAIGVALGAGYFFTATSNVISIAAYVAALSLVGAYREYSWLRKSVAQNASQ